MQTLLPHYPVVNQLDSPTLDGGSDNNKWFNCVICSLLSILFYYRTDLIGKLSPDEVKDAVYGVNYANAGTDAERFIRFFAQYGMRLYAVSGSTELAHEYIRKLVPVVFTEIDPYVDTSKPQYQGWTHVCAFCGEYSTGNERGLIAMDPFGGHIVTKSDKDWMNVLVGNQLWLMEPTHPAIVQPQPQQLAAVQEEEMPLDIHSPFASTYFHEIDAQHWQCKETNCIIAYAHLDFYRKHQGVFRLPRSNELYLKEFPGTAIMIYECAIAAYDPKRVIDNPPTDEACYLLHLDKGIGQSLVAQPLIKALESQIAALQAQNAQLAHVPQTTQAHLTALQSALSEVQTISQEVSHLASQLQDISGGLHA